MSNKMLIDASHPEETRVIVTHGNKIEEFDFESEHKKQIRGNIYLAKVTRVEPSLQAAFVDYGGNRHGFLAFSEIHPDYYQIPLAARQALLQAEAEDAANDPDFESSDEAAPVAAKPTSRSKPQAAETAEAGEDANGAKSRPRRSRRGKKSGDDTKATAASDDAETASDESADETVEASAEAATADNSD